jgi:hypothetical protein
MIPALNADTGNLPPGEHRAAWEEVVARYGTNLRRRELLDGLRKALDLLKAAGCRTVYLDGSIVTAKALPADFDACWDTEGVDFDRIDDVFIHLDRGRATQKKRFLGELLIADAQADLWSTLFRDFFQMDRDGNPKGIVVIDLETLG